MPKSKRNRAGQFTRSILLHFHPPSYLYTLFLFFSWIRPKFVLISGGICIIDWDSWLVNFQLACSSTLCYLLGKYPSFLVNYEEEPF
jgi:hypothetical protein